MDNQGTNSGHHRFLTLAMCGAGGVAVLGIAMPFMTNPLPSEKVKAAGATTEVDVSKIEAGQVLTAKWQGEPIQLVNRTDQRLKDLKNLDDSVMDSNSEVGQQPGYAKNKHRSTKPDLLTAAGICTHLGCSLTYRPDVAPTDLGANWKGDFFYPRHGSKFNMAGRVYKGVPTSTNLVVPPYKYLGDATVLAGED